MKRLLLHIGTGKTGTTGIQEALARNEEQLRAAGYHLIESNRAREGSGKHGVSWRDQDDPSWKALAEEAESLRDSDVDVILSNEGLWNQQAEVFQAIHDLFPEFTPMALFYVREQAEYVQTLGLQFAKGRHGGSFDYLDPDDLAEYMNRRPAMDYYDTCQRLDAGLGKGAVSARLFAPDHLHENDIVADFFHQIGFEGDIERPTGIVNPGVSVELARSLARYDNDPPPEGVRKMELRDVAASMTLGGIGTKYFLPREYVEQIRAIYRDSNVKFAKEYLQNADELPEKDVWRAEGEDQSEQIEALLLETASDYPTLGEGGWGNRRTGLRLLSEGFEIKERPRPMTGTIEGQEATMRFRTSNAVRTWLRDELRVQINTLSDAPLQAVVSVNGTELGEFRFPDDNVPIPLDLCQPYNKVALTLRPTSEERAPITGLTFADLVG